MLGVQTSLTLKSVFLKESLQLLVDVQVGCYSDATKTYPTEGLGGLEEKSTSWEHLKKSHVYSLFPSLLYVVILIVFTYLCLSLSFFVFDLFVLEN